MWRVQKLIIYPAAFLQNPALLLRAFYPSSYFTPYTKFLNIFLRTVGHCREKVTTSEVTFLVSFIPFSAG